MGVGDGGGRGGVAGQHWESFYFSDLSVLP